MVGTRGHTRTTLRADGVIATQMIGRADGPMVRAMHDQVIPLLAPGREIFLVDTTQVPSFDPVSLPPAARTFLAALKEHGCMIIGVIPNMGVRMMGVSLCAAARVKLEAFATAELAEHRLRELLRSKALA